MTIFAFQKDFVQELKKLFTEFRIDVKKELKKVNIFMQDIPFSQQKNAKEIFPYIIVRVEEGSISTEKNICQVVLIFGVYNDDIDRQGYKDLLNIMQKVLYHYSVEKIISQRYVVNGEMEWVIQNDENIFPHFIGGISFDVELPAIRIFDDNV